ncbi:heterokaryon incompatibility protein, partial [Colletotrichum tofieldiae]
MSDLSLKIIGTLNSGSQANHAQHERIHGSECHPSKRRLPKRLIDTRPGYPMRLRASKDVENCQEGVRYATLSYCWGASLPVRTTKDTEMDFSTIIQESLLPKTFRHAIRLVRSLEIPYIWIDSLCIVQDDPLEWQSEASYMEDYYSGSTLTVAATDALDSNGGCFPDDDDDEEDVTMNRRISSKSQHDLGSLNRMEESPLANPNVRMFSYTHQISDGNTFRNIMVRLQNSHPRSIRRRAPLNTRGCVLQEQILSHRTVHCMKSEIYWECRCVSITQAAQRYDDHDPVLGHSSASSKSQIIQMWPGWVEDYSRRNFTIASDRSRAFAGISSYYERQMLQEPILGLSRHELARDLAWVRAGPKRGQGISGAPSWTWFSCNAPVWIDHWGFHNEDETRVKDWTSLVSHRIDWEGRKMTSNIQSCTLIVRGPMKEFTFCMAPESRVYNPPYLVVDGQETDSLASPVPWDCPGQFDDDEYP